MKKITITLLIILCYSLNAIATINLNVQGGFGPTNSAVAIQAYACQTNTFNLTLSDSIPISVAPSSGLYLRIDNAAFIQFPQLITLLPDTDSRYFEIYHNSDPVNPFAFSLSAFLMTTPMVVGCDFIMQTSSSVSHGIGLYMNGDLSANITGTFNGDTIANGQISYDVYYPYLAIQGASTPLEVDYLTVHLPNNRVERTLSYVNNGSTDSITAMELNFVFTDRLQCESFEFDSIYYYIDGASPTAILITPNDSVETPVINIQMIHGQVLHIREVITLKDNCFLSDCDDAERTFNSNLNWGCSTLCMNIPDQARIIRGHLRPGLTLSRISPGITTTINAGWDAYWDTLFSQQPITNYTFRLANRDSDIVNDVRFVIYDYLSSSMYFVADTDSISIHPSFSDFRNYHSTVIPYSTSGKLPSCVRNFYPNAVQEFVFYVDYLMPFDSIDITVPLIYCCPDNDNGIDTTVINLFENSKRLNTWGVNAQGVSDCNQSPATLANTSLSNAYLHNIESSQFSLNDGYQLDQLDLRQNFIPNGITFSVPPDSLCSPFTSLALNNFQFNEDANGHFLFRDANLFTKSFSTVQTDTIRVDSLFLQFRIRTEPGLRISNSLTDFSINSATHHWAASELILAHSDSCSLSNVYTVTFSSANFPFLNSAAPFLREVYELVKSSDFNFDIRGCCCASSSNNNPNYIIETLIAGYDHCFIPMKKVDGNSEIHCPGCNMPGTIVQTPDDQILERTNFGYYDANDNGLADSTLVRIDSTYLLAHRSEMDINHSMVGDTLSSTMSVLIDNSGAISIDSLASRGIILTHLYAEQKIEMSNSDQFDLHPFQLTITLVATNQSVTITPLSTHWNQVVKDVRDSIGISGKLDIIFYNLSPALLDTIFGISNYAFAGGEEIILQVNLKVCKNYQPDRESKLLVNNQFASKVGLNMYLTDANLDSLNIYDAFTSHNLNYPVAQDTGVIFANELYMCETRSAMHYFYSIYSRSFSGISYDFARPCIRILDIDHEVAIGGEKLNPFRREFRPIPEFFPILINLPGGIANYHFYNNGYGTSDVRTYYTSGCGISSLHSSFTDTNLVFSPIFSNPHTIARDSLITNNAFPPTCGSNFNAQSNLFYSGDEYLNQRLSFPLTYTVCRDSSVRIDSSTITTNLQVTTCSSNSITALSTINNDHPWISTNFVTGFLSSTPLSVNATQNRVEFQIELEGTYNYDRLIRNLFIYFPDTTAYTDITIDTFPAHHLILPNGTKIVYFELGDMTSVIFNSIYPVFININNCDLDSIPFVVGFDCLGYPTLLQLQTGNICQLYSRSLHLQIIEAKVTATIEQNVSINTCQIDTITTTLNTIGSNVNDLRFKLDLLNSFTQIISARDRRYHNGNSVSDSIGITQSGNTYYFTPIIPFDDFVLGDSIKFDVVYSLLDSTDSQPFSIDFEYTNLCGDIGPPSAIDTALVIGGFNCFMGVANCFQVTATQNSINCAGSPVNISTSIIGHSTGLTYAWTSNPGSFNSNATFINPSPLVMTTYIVVVSDTSGTTSIDSVTVTPIPVDSCCIPPGFNLSSGDLQLFNTSASAYIQQYGANTISTGNIILIVGTFTVDTNFTFTGCSNIVMAPGALIDVLPSRTLTIFDCHQYSCGSMSQGIRARPGKSKVNIRYSTIEDAQYGVDLGMLSSLKSIGNHFKNNYIGINAVSPGNSAIVVGLTISGTSFESTRNLSPKYIAQMPLPKLRPLAGINLYNVLSVSINPDTANIFSNMNMGIIANRTNINVSNCKFINMLNYDAAAYYLQSTEVGSAIYGQGSVGNAYNVTFTGLKDSLNPDFENCMNGIKTLRMNLYASNSYMENVDVGIEGARNFNGIISITGNIINANLTGISAALNWHADGITILDNDIKGGQNVVQNSGAISSAIGIDIQGNNNSKSTNFLVANNMVDLFDYGHTGIHMNSSKFVEITENFVTLENSGTNTTMNGITVENSEQSSISCNGITGTRINQSNDYHEAAILYISSLGNVISQNTMNYTSQGIEVKGICDDGVNQTVIEKNTIVFHYNGLNYSGSAYVNKQENTGNLWMNPINYPGFGAVNYNTDPNIINYERYRVNGAGQSLPPNRFPAGWFGTNGLQDSIINFGDCDHYNFVNPNPIPDLLKLSEDSILTIEYQQELNWQAKLKVYQKLIEHPEYLAENADLADFYTLNAATSIHYIAKVNVENDKLLANQQTVIENIKNNSIDIYQKSGLLKQIFTQLEEPDLEQTEIDSLLTLLDRLMVELDQSIQLNDFYVMQLRNSISDKIDLIGQLTDSIQATEIYEVNEKVINEISTNIELNPDERLLNSYESILFGIATQCPLAGGTAVYKARAYYKKINPNVFYDDVNTCIQSGIVYRKKDQPKLQYCNLYPNPTSGVLFISYSITAEATLEITDASGRLLLKSKLESTSSSTKVDLSLFQNGIYFYRILEETSILNNGKIILMK